MTPAEFATLAAKIDALHDDVIEVKELAKATNGRVRTLEIWRSTIDTLSRARDASRNVLAAAVVAVTAAMVGAVCGGLITVLLNQ